MNFTFNILMNLMNNRNHFYHHAIAILVDVVTEGVRKGLLI